MLKSWRYNTAVEYVITMYKPQGLIPSAPPKVLATWKICFENEGVQL